MRSIRPRGTKRRGAAVARFAVSTIACAAFSCAAFFCLLSLWGLAVAPFAHLKSASFVIVCALAAAAAITVAAWRFAMKKFNSRKELN